MTCGCCFSTQVEKVCNQRHTHILSPTILTSFFIDDCVRFWVMRPRHGGRIITFERMDKVTITINYNDKREVIELINFVWKMKVKIQKKWKDEHVSTLIPYLST